MVHSLMDHQQQQSTVCKPTMSVDNGRSFSLPPDHFESLRRNAVSVERINNVDAVTLVSTTTDDRGGAIKYGYCHMPFFYTFSFFASPDAPRQRHENQGAFEGAAAIHLAMMHLNTGDGTVVADVQGLNETCPLRFTFEVFDTENYETTLVNSLIELNAREPNQTEEPLPCAFLGSGRSALSIAMAVFTGVSGYPQMSGTSTSSLLDDRSQYGLFSRLIPSDDGTAIAVILYLRDVIQTNHLAVVHSNNAYGNSFLASLQKAATQHAPDMNIQSIDVPINIITDQDLTTAVTFLKNTRFRYIFAIMDGAKNYEGVMTEAHRQGIAGDEYVWIYSDSLFAAITQREYSGPDDPLAVAARGSSTLLVQWGVPGTPTYDHLVASIQELQNYPDHLEFLQNKQPAYADEPDYEPLRVERIFRSRDPGPNAVFLYDATIAMGLAACAVSDPTTYFDGQTHYDEIVGTKFVGASGPIVIDPSTGSRDPSSAYFQLLNFVERRDPETGRITFEPVQTDLYRNGTWENVTPYVYGDGTTRRPPPLPVVQVDNNYITRGLRGTGFALSALVMLLTVGFAAWTIWRRKSKVVIASQPIFLRLICAGVFLMGSAIIPLSIDDKIASVQGCDIACMAVPWLFTLGFALSFAALFSKTWRINKLFHSPSLKRVKVTPRDVMLPLILLLVLNVLILCLWSSLDPLRWEREITQVDVFGQTSATEGHCESGSFAAFVSVLGIVNMGALVIAAYQAYCARDIALEFSESIYVGRAIGLFLLACLYGIPVLAITWDSPSARYFVLMILAFVCSISVLLLIFVPKVIFDRHRAFKRASLIVATQARSSLVADRSGVFVSGMSTTEDSTTSFDSDEEGVRIVDNGTAREELKRQNKELHEERHKLVKRVQNLEYISKRNLGYVPDDDDEKEAEVSAEMPSIAEKEQEEEEEERESGVSAYQVEKVDVPAAEVEENKGDSV